MAFNIDKSLRQQSRSKSRSRKVSPGCFATLSAPAPRAKYRESNASRLRQEIKGMTVTGVVRGPGSPRSKSSSPTKIISHPATPKQNNSGTATPKTRGRSPEKSIDLITSRLQNPNNQSAKNRQAENIPTEDSPDKSLDLIATPRTMSETSNVGRETQERLRSVMAKASSGYVVDTRSKTLTTTAVRQPTSAVKLNASRRSSSNISPAAGFGNGYGKPLVTSLTKRLTVMKTLPKPTNDVKASKLPVSRAKSPLQSWRTEPKESASSVTGTKFDITTSKTKSPAKGTTGNKLRTTNYTVPIKPDDKVAIMRSSVPGKQIRGSSTSMNRNSNKSPIRSDNKQGALSQRLKPVKPIFQKDTKSRSPEFSQSPSRRKGPASQATINKAPQEMKTDKKDPPGLRPGLIPRSSPSIRVPEKKTERPLSELRDMLTERLKQPLCSDKPISVIGRPASSLYSRSFKPQLEDIKSSFMLLNKKPQEQNKDKENRQELVSVLKPKPFKEEFRKQQLKEIKNKFQSKHFYDDSKFDKIEGLNWISWK